MVLGFEYPSTCSDTQKQNDVRWDPCFRSQSLVVVLVLLYQDPTLRYRSSVGVPALLYRDPSSGYRSLVVSARTKAYRNPCLGFWSPVEVLVKGVGLPRIRRHFYRCTCYQFDSMFLESGYCFWLNEVFYVFIGYKVTIKWVSDGKTG